MADYTTVAKVKADLPDLDNSALEDYDQVIAGMITAASRLIDREVGGWPNYFVASTSDETRYFNGSGMLEQWIDPMTELTSVSVSESGGRAATDYTDWVEDTDFYVWPYNYSLIGVPIQKLIVDNDSGSKGVFYGVRKGVKVVGKFGYSTEVPDDIEQACKVTAMRWFMRSKQSYQDTSASERLGQLLYTKSLDPDVIEILQAYKLGNAVM